MPDSATVRADPLDPAVLLTVLARVKSGDFTARMPLDWTSEPANTNVGFNDVIIANRALEQEVARIRSIVGALGRLSHRALLDGTAQSWSGSVESVNNLIEALMRPPSEMQKVIGAGAEGDLSKKVTVEVSSEMFELMNSIKDVTDNLNQMAADLTGAPPGRAHAVTLEVVMDRVVIDDLRRLGEPTGDEFLADIVSQFVTGTEILLTELRSAIEIDDAPVVAWIAHSIKGSSDQLGGRRLALACSRLERLATANSLFDGKMILREIDVEYQDLCGALTRTVSTPARGETGASRA